jgi:uncharacterized protein YbjT (DUF2867 family)
MRVLLLGANGLIGSGVAARLHRDGIEIVGVARSSGPLIRRLPVAQWILLDLRHALTPEAWLPHLVGIDALVNCAGVLQDNARDSTTRVHTEAPMALWQACEQAGVRKVVQVSAVGVDRGGTTDFSATKAKGDASLMASGLDWVILRPSVVLGRAAHGGSALIRGLAGLPWLPRIRDAGPVQLVQLDDVAETVATLLRGGAPSRMVLEVTAPERLTFDQIVAAYRQWLGRGPAASIAVPEFLMRMLYRLGDALAWLGWRPPIRTTARRELSRGVVGDPTAWTKATGIAPRGLADALAGEPSGVQERWFSNLYLLKPLIIGTFALYWLATGIVSLGPSYELAEGMMRMAGGGALSAPMVIAGGLADIAIGIGVAFRRSARAALIAALLLSILYLIAGTILAPALWRDPLGPMLKIWPLIALNLACLAILEER